MSLPPFNEYLGTEVIRGDDGEPEVPGAEHLRLDRF